MSREEEGKLNEEISNMNLASSSITSSTIKSIPTASGIGSSNPVNSKRRHSRLSFLPRVASEYTEATTFHHKTHSSIHSNSKASKYRIVLMGSSRTGKTAIIKRFLYDTFIEEHCPTVEELHKSEYEIKGIGLVAVEILDTSGTFSFPAMKRLAINSGNAFILVYAVDDKASFEEVSSLREMIAVAKKEVVEGSVPIVVVGNKSDLSDKQVAKEMVEFECIDWDVGFVECSAKSNENVIQIFQQLLLQAHLKGSLQIIAGPSQNPNVHNNFFSSNHNLSHRLENGTSKDEKTRRRSSLPVSDLFHYSISLRPHRFTKKKRGSCAPS